MWVENLTGCFDFRDFTEHSQTNPIPAKMRGRLRDSFVRCLKICGKIFQRFEHPNVRLNTARRQKMRGP